MQSARIAPGGQISHRVATACPLVTFDALFAGGSLNCPANTRPRTMGDSLPRRDARGHVPRWGWQRRGHLGRQRHYVSCWGLVRATIRGDSLRKPGAVPSTGSQVFSNLHFHADSIAAFSSLTASAPSAGDTLLDQLNLSAKMFHSPFSALFSQVPQ